MQSFMITLLICSVTMSALALVYMGATPLLAKHYSVTGRYYAWLVIVIGFIFPFRPHVNNAIVKINMPVYTVMPMIQSGDGTFITTPAPNVPTASFTHISWWQITAAIWLAGMMVFLVYHGIKHYRFLKLAARWSKDITDQETLDLIQTLKAQMDLTSDIGLKVCDSIGSPMMIGFVNPRILLPKTDFSKEEFYLILKHELVHYKRKDLWYKCLVLIATAVHWYNPIVYLMAKVIDTQCELSCDKEVIRSADADQRLSYCQTIIGVIRQQSKLKTALSTNFYGGKKGMKERIFSIMDRNKKKTGLVILGGVLILTLGTGSVFTASAKTPGSPDIISEDIKEGFSFGYKLLPDPDLYSQYSSYGITISDNGEMLLYNGQRVRLFVDEYSDAPAFFSDEAGTIDLRVIRNGSGNLTSIERISESKAKEYRLAFFSDDINAAAKAPEAKKAKSPTGRTKFDQYSSYGIVLSSDGEVLQYNASALNCLWIRFRMVPSRHFGLTNRVQLTYRS